MNLKIIYILALWTLIYFIGSEINKSFNVLSWHPFVRILTTYEAIILSIVIYFYKKDER
jgi:hypothetical protein